MKRPFLAIASITSTLCNLAAGSPSPTPSPTATVERITGPSLSPSPQTSASARSTRKLESQALKFNPPRVVPMVSPSASPGQSAPASSKKGKKGKADETKQESAPVSPGQK